MQEDYHTNHGSYKKQQMMVILWDHRRRSVAIYAIEEERL